MKEKKEQGLMLPFAQTQAFYLRRGQFHVDMGEYREAIPLLLRAKEMDGPKTQAALLLAEAYAEMGYNPLALETLLDMVWQCESLPEQFDYLLGCEYLVAQEFDMAIACFQRFYEHHPQGGDIGLELAEVKQIMDGVDVSAWEGAFPEGDANQNGAQILAQHASKLMDQHKYHDAIQNFELARQLAPDNDDIALMLATALWTAGRAEEAHDICDLILFHDNENLQAHCLTALIAQQVGSWTLREHELGILPLLAKEQPQEMFRVAITLGELGEHTLMQEMLLLCHGDVDYEPWVLHAQAANACVLGNWQRARQIWKRLQRMLPGHPVLAYYLRAIEQEGGNAEMPGNQDERSQRYPYYFALPEEAANACKQQIDELGNPFFPWQNPKEDALLNMEELLRWGFASSHKPMQNKCVLLALRYAAHHKDAMIQQLRRALIASPLTDSQKKRIADALYCLQAPQPYLTWNEEGRGECHPPLARWGQKLPAEYAAPLRLLQEQLRDDVQGQRVAQWLWRDYLQRLHKEPLPLEEPEYFAAALSLLQKRCRQQPARLSEEAGRFRVAAQEVERALCSMYETMNPKARRSFDETERLAERLA